MKILFPILATFALALSACSGGTALSKISTIPGLEVLTDAPVAMDPSTFAQIDQIGAASRKAINVIRIEQKAALDMIEIARDGMLSSYMSASRRGVILKNGIITQTQGIGGDLSISQHQTYDLLDTDRIFTKTHGYLGGHNKIQSVAFRCIRTARATDYFGLRDSRRLLTPVDEVCSNNTQSHENVYFLYPKSGQVFRSRQWVSDQIGFLRVEQIQLPNS